MERKYYFCSDQGFLMIDKIQDILVLNSAPIGVLKIQEAFSLSRRILSISKVFTLVGRESTSPLFLFDMTKSKAIADRAKISNWVSTESHETASTMRDCKAMSIAEIINIHMPALAKILQA